jgi:hypothetical protein
MDDRGADDEEEVEDEPDEPWSRRVNGGSRPPSECWYPLRL